jgi:hypothetical protein
MKYRSIDANIIKPIPTALSEKLYRTENMQKVGVASRR